MKKTILTATIIVSAAALAQALPGTNDQVDREIQTTGDMRGYQEAKAIFDLTSSPKKPVFLAARASYKANANQPGSSDLQESKDLQRQALLNQIRKARIKAHPPRQRQLRTAQASLASALTGTLLYKFGYLIGGVGMTLPIVLWSLGILLFIQGLFFNGVAFGPEDTVIDLEREYEERYGEPAPGVNR